jgi:tetratricopeptide (TPR) repeat protein
MDINKGMEHFRNGEAFYKGGEFGRAVDEFSKAIEFMPESEEAYLWRAHSYRESRDIDRAIPDIRKALEIYPEHVGAKEFLENVLKMQAAKNAMNAMCEERVVVRTVRSNPPPGLKSIRREVHDEIQREAEAKVRLNNEVERYNQYIDDNPVRAAALGLEKIEYDPMEHFKDEISLSVSKMMRP